MTGTASVAELNTIDYPAVMDMDDAIGANDGETLDGLVGMAPRAGFRFSRRLFLLSDPGSAQAESISDLRAHLLAQHVRNGRRSLAFCSPAEGVGSTYLAVNLAVAFAQAGISTLLIDANMHDPGVQKYIRPKEEPAGLRQCLTGSDLGHGNAIYDDVLQNLSVLYAGGVADNAQELLATRHFKSLMDNCMRDYEMTIVDSPPGLNAADGLRIATVVGYALVVARRNETLVNDIRMLMDGLLADRVRIVGTFLNDF
ncbi:MAG: CpsD/CapB family tyrosine-protein kinase [Sphingobium sp.]